jgi:hypothetical protein
MTTPPPHPVPLPRRPYRSRLVKFISMGCYNKGENSNCPYTICKNPLGLTSSRIG